MIERSHTHRANSEKAKSLHELSRLDALNKFHRRLCLCLEMVQEAVERMEDVTNRVGLIVLGEDLEVLVEECEEWMLAEDSTYLHTCDSYLSFAARSCTVIDEVKEFLGLIGKSPQ